MYHHINSNDLSKDEKLFDEHLKYISKNFTTVFPKDGELPKNSVCLVFDDAYADFYFFAYPLLQKYKLKALLAVPTKYILQDTKESKETRINFLHDDCFQNYKKAPFCTFKELKTMSKSGLVKITSHSQSHVNLCENGTNLDEELNLSKQILEKKLNVKVDTFVYPFGKYDKKILQKTHEVYKYSFRIGSAIQKNFSGINGVNYRIKGDNLKNPSEIFSTKNMLKYKFKAFIKRVSGE